jgi:hypothetical protein
VVPLVVANPVKRPGRRLVLRTIREKAVASVADLQSRITKKGTAARSRSAPCESNESDLTPACCLGRRVSLAAVMDLLGRHQRLVQQEQQLAGVALRVR